ncbi:DUF302 domain-containing protein [Psychroflexus aestuariivivens]|uniref:DUF302 domain-containing protein n=1 Tax=Psychroflexus aestuariivivens TaxID=1795040 RepID=UPI000FD8FBBC|nr:DUF302 domain-containing protein [Psychroflexus aestuariivivens]
MKSQLISKYFFIFLISLIVLSCKNDVDKPKDEKTSLDEPKVEISDGMLYNKVKSLDGTLKNFKRFLGTNPGLNIYAHINHKENADKVGMELGENQVFFFDNPRFSSPLIRENPLVALEFPNRVAFCKKENESFVFSRSGEWIKQRYGLKFSPALQSYNNLAKTFIKQASMAEFAKEDSIKITKHKGIESVKSTKDFKKTVAGIEKVLDENQKIFKVVSLNFKEKAEEINIALEPLHLFIFGNPEVGTQFMQKNPNFSIDLPLRILVRETPDGEVLVYYNDMNFLAEIHNVEFDNDLPTKVNMIVQKIISDGTSTE